MYYVGFDISKEKLDLSVLNEERTVIESKVIENKPARISKWFDQLPRKLECSSEDVLVCCENTGIYGEPLVSTCVAKGIPIWVENAYKIKKASHDLRGKSDAQDAQRIADYALRYADRATLYTPPSLETKKLSELIALRDDLLKHKNQAENRIREAKAMDPVRYKIINGCFKRMIKGVEKELEELIQEKTPQAALTELFLELKTDQTPAVVERIVTDIDAIVRVVRFPGWQNSNSGEREVQSSLRKILWAKYKIKDQVLFDRAYGYIKEYY